MLTLDESLKEIEKTFDPSKSNSKKYPIRGQRREDWDKGRVGRTKMDLIKEEYDMFSLKGIISLKNLEKSMDLSLAMYNQFRTSNENSKVKPISFIEFYSRLIHWEKLYGTSDSKVKELQKFYRRRNKEIKNFENAKRMEMTQEEIMETRRELNALQTERRTQEMANKTKRKRGRPRTKNIKTPPTPKKVIKHDFDIPPLPLHLAKKLTNQIHNNNNTLSTKLSTSVKERFEKHCSKKGKSTSTLLREILVTYLQNKDFQQRVNNHIAQTEIDELNERIAVLQKSMVKMKRKYTLKKPKRTPMNVAKEIRKRGESWKDAVRRASKILIKENKKR